MGGRVGKQFISRGRGNSVRIESPEVDIDVVVRGKSITYAVVEKGSLRREYFGPLREVTVRGSRISCYAPLFSPYRSIQLSDNGSLIESAARSMDSLEIIEVYKTVLDSIGDRFKSDLNAAKSFAEKERMREMIEALERLHTNISMGETSVNSCAYVKKPQPAVEIA